MSFTLSMFIDHDYHGLPIEYMTIRVTMDDAAKIYERELKQLAIERLHHHVKRMPHRYWTERNLDAAI